MPRVPRTWFPCILLLLVVGCNTDYVSSTAIPQGCQNGVKDGAETDTDCGGIDCNPCAVGLTCAADRDCATELECTHSVCWPAHCTDGTKSGNESDRDCGGSCPACSDGDRCKRGRDCTSLHCADAVCRAPSCDDDVKNQLESDVDCGDAANQCPRCASGSICDENGDCESGICASGTCAVPSCDDSVKNGAEGDVDCGGECPSPCQDGAFCGVGEDCKSSVCDNGICLASSCGDEIRNGQETDTDCGGACEPCLLGDDCVLDTDCASTHCAEGMCRTATCKDEATDQGESDVDCGDPAGKCRRCDTGEVCHDAASCLSGVCAEGRCAVASCEDLVKNGAEGDVDCGGPCPLACPDLAGCMEMSDCQSAVCKNRVCQVPKCSDNRKNGTETDLDCGGGCPTLCEVGEGCEVDGDCAINSCNKGVCADPSCSNARLDGTETDVDCGGDCPACADLLGCLDATDCVSQVCTGSVCQAPTCTDSAKNGFESDVDCGQGCPESCQDGQACERNDDCESGVCSGTECQVPVCDDLVRNDVETDIDCGGPVCVEEDRLCELGRHCLLDADCQSEVCDATTATCVPQSCSDTRKNQDETDVDCGGGCAPCDAKKRCRDEADCIDKMCESGRCVAASCSDGVTNGNEGDTDCGGNCPARCLVGDTCRVASDCEQGVCATESPVICLNASCEDGVKNGEEVGIDCAGPCTARCPTGQPCNDTSDCVPGDNCSPYGICEPPNCRDGVQGLEETDVDCGGPECGATCEVGEGCLVDTDCIAVVSGKCNAQFICAEAACGDQAKNGTETDVDCGGDAAFCATRCATDEVCDSPSDCESGVCTNRSCVAPSCSDNVTNGGESDQDCGEVCALVGSLCGEGADCGKDADCATGWCQAGSCAVRSCTDGTKNGSEGDVDCGAICIGATSDPLCRVGDTCGVDEDCNSGWCNSVTGICGEPTCTDGFTNHGETATDCGGPACTANSNCLVAASSAACRQCQAVGDGCAVDTDCLSMTCIDGYCAEADNCIGQLLTDADHLLPNGARICASINAPNGNPGCLAYLRCFFVHDCNPTGTCSSSPNGICNVNAVGGGNEPQNAALTTYRTAGCSSPLSPMP